MRSSGYISAITIGLFQTLFTILEDLERIDVQIPNEVHTNPIENGNSCTVIILAAIIFEGEINNLRFRSGEKTGKEGEEISKYFQKRTGNFLLSECISEIIVVRDAIVHAHLWKGEVTWDKNYQLMFNGEPEIVAGFGDNKFKNTLDPATRTTKMLKLNLFPTRIWRQDAYIVLKKVVDALKEIPETKELTDRYQYKFRHEMLSINNILERIDNSFQKEE